MTSSETLFQSLGDEITTGMRRLPIPGLAIGVWHAGIEQAAGFGVTSVENPLPVTPDVMIRLTHCANCIYKMAC